MSFLDQPEEIIIEQLRYLPLEDLLSICSTNLAISRICQGKQLWQLRLIDDFKVKNISEIGDPRSYYFDLLDKRSFVLTLVLQGVDENLYEFKQEYIEELLNASSYQEFVEMQRDLIGQLTEKELNGVIHTTTIGYVNFSRETYSEIEGFFFDRDGNIVVFSMY